MDLASWDWPFIMDSRNLKKSEQVFLRTINSPRQHGHLLSELDKYYLKSCFVPYNILTNVFYKSHYRLIFFTWLSSFFSYQVHEYVLLEISVEPHCCPYPSISSHIHHPRPSNLHCVFRRTGTASYSTQIHPPNTHYNEKKKKISGYDDYYYCSGTCVTNQIFSGCRAAVTGQNLTYDIICIDKIVYTFLCGKWWYLYASWELPLHASQIFFMCACHPATSLFSSLV